VPVRIFDDPRPAALDFRTLACVSMHDGMSLKKGSGRGCYATFATLTAELGCDASNLSKSLKRLVEWGYLSEERQVDRRRKTYRVIFDGENSWRNGQQSLVGETANEPPEIVGNAESRNGGNPLQDEQHYSSLKGLDASEEEKLDSAEAARFAARGSPEKISFEENVGAQLAMLERALKAEEQINFVEWYQYVGSIWEMDEHRGRASRLAEELAERMTDEEFEQCAIY
jgi:DNA-binding MarR family transcriptional regulator